MAWLLPVAGPFLKDDNRSAVVVVVAGAVIAYCNSVSNPLQFITYELIRNLVCGD